MFLNKNISQGEDILHVSLHTSSSHLYLSLFFNVSEGPVMCLPDTESRAVCQRNVGLERST